MPNLKPLVLWGHAGGPNSWKVAIILEELGLPYDHKFIDFGAMKAEPYISLNPNGRVPSLEDPNTEIKAFESGACIDYLIDTYDKDHKLSYASLPEKYQARSWEHFQMSGQGPYFGQLAWFKFFHKEKLPSAVERYANEVVRVTGVLDAHLRKQQEKRKGETEVYLVGDGSRVTYADLMFVMWSRGASTGLVDAEKMAAFDVYAAWLQRLLERPAVKRTLEEKAKHEGPKH